MTTTKTFTPESFLVARATNPAIAENWTDQDWGNDATTAQLRWEMVGQVTTKPKGKLEFSEDYNLVDVDACKAVGRELEYFKHEAAARMSTIQVNGNVYRVSRL